MDFLLSLVVCGHYVISVCASESMCCLLHGIKTDSELRLWKTLVIGSRRAARELLAFCATK